MWASWNGHLDVVRTLLDGKADVNAKSKVRNLMMMMIIIIILFTMLMMLLMMIIILLTILMMLLLMIAIDVFM